MLQLKILHAVTKDSACRNETEDGACCIYDLVQPNKYLKKERDRDQGKGWVESLGEDEVRTRAGLFRVKGSSG